MDRDTPRLRIGTVDEVKQQGTMVVAGGDRPVAIFYHQDHIYAVDNRCPHMGFPLHRGTTQDGILTCHWHHARFDLASGCTFDLWADDIPAYPVDIHDGEVWVTLLANENTLAHHQRRLREGMEQNIRLVQAKAIIGLLDAGSSPAAVLEQAGLYGVQHRQAGWSSGLTILTAMGNLLPELLPDQRAVPLYQGVLHVASDCSGEPSQVLLQPLATERVSLATLKRWLRRWVEVRDRDGAERCVLTALAQGAAAADMTDLLMSAATDHFYLDVGHTLDFINKSFELLEQIGWDHAARVLPSLLGHLTAAERSEERHAWRHPVDLVPLVHEACEALPGLLQAGRHRTSWQGMAPLVDTLLGDAPHEMVAALGESLRHGAAPLELAQALAGAACRRLVHFHTSNEFADWIAVLHTFTYSNALYQAMKRAPSPELLRGVFHGAMRVYLDRFLNVPPAPVPPPYDAARPSRSADEFPQRFLTLLDTQQQVDAAGAMVYEYLTAGYPVQPLYRTLVSALVREDADFHSFQMLEAAIQQHRDLGDTQAGHLMLVAAARFLAAHAPTQRERLQTATIALRLHRGETLYD